MIEKILENKVRCSYSFRQKIPIKTENYILEDGSDINLELIELEKCNFVVLEKTSLDDVLQNRQKTPYHYIVKNGNVKKVPLFTKSVKNPNTAVTKEYKVSNDVMSFFEKELFFNQKTQNMYNMDQYIIRSSDDIKHIESICLNKLEEFIDKELYNLGKSKIYTIKEYETEQLSVDFPPYSTYEAAKTDEFSKAMKLFEKNIPMYKRYSNFVIKNLKFTKEILNGLEKEEIGDIYKNNKLSRDDKINLLELEKSLIKDKLRFLNLEYNRSLKYFNKEYSNYITDNRRKYLEKELKKIDKKIKELKIENVDTKKIINKYKKSKAKNTKNIIKKHYGINTKKIIRKYKK